jgi:uncharacterized hydrophobic protein (TIGR00271 family)
MARHPGQTAADSPNLDTGGSPSPPRARHVDDAEDRSIMLAAVARDARLDRKFLLLVVLSTAIATLGLLQSSAAVVIGAMLVSPFLGPIMGVGFGLATLDSTLIRRALLTLLAGVGVAVALAVLIVWVSPVQDITPELRARTQPNLLDLGVAVVGGIAGVYAILRRLSGVMVGVAIATALVPPLSTIGFGMATGRPDLSLGSALLFLTNTLAIAFAATLVARINRFGPSLTPKHTMFQVVGIIATLGVLSIPLAVALNRIAREVAVRNAVQAELDGLIDARDRIDELTINLEGDTIRIDGVVLVNQYRPSLTKDLAVALADDVARPVKANLVQLRQQTDGTQFQDALNRRLTALERRDAETVRLLTDLTVGGAIPREAITLDPQARRAVVTMPSANAAGEALDGVLEAVRAAHPGWMIVAVEPVEPAR